jgi:ATP-binding cassette subfamily F protein 2
MSCRKACKAVLKAKWSRCIHLSVHTDSSTAAGSPIGTPLTSIAANSSEDLLSMAKLNIVTNSCRSPSGVLVPDAKGRDIKIDLYTLSFHGRLLIEGAEIVLNYGQQYGLLGQNGSRKSTFLASIAHRNIDIPDHIDIYLVNSPSWTRSPSMPRLAVSCMALGSPRR